MRCTDGHHETRSAHITASSSSSNVGGALLGDRATLDIGPVVRLCEHRLLLSTSRHTGARGRSSTQDRPKTGLSAGHASLSCTIDLGKSDHRRTCLLLVAAMEIGGGTVDIEMHRPEQNRQVGTHERGANIGLQRTHHAADDRQVVRFAQAAEVQTVSGRALSSSLTSSSSPVTTSGVLGCAPQRERSRNRW